MIRNSFLIHILILLFVILTTSISFTRTLKTRIDVKPVLKTELNLVLAQADKLHSACVLQNDRVIDETTKSFVNRLGKAEKHSTLAKVQQTHLVKILRAIRKNLVSSLNQMGANKKEFIKEAFKDVVQLTRLYNLDNYNVFFCSKDSSLWLQKGAKAKNPIHPEKFLECGKIVR